MWQKKNPYLEYAIALLRGQKEGHMYVKEVRQFNHLCASRV